MKRRKEMKRTTEQILRLYFAWSSVCAGGKSNMPFETVATVKGKGKAVPLQAWTDPEGSRKLRFPDFVTTAQDGGRLSAPTK